VVRDAEHDRHVGVVPARVHAALDQGRERDVGFLVDRQSVDVGTQHHRLAGPSRVQHGHRPRRRRASLDFEAEVLQAFGDLAAGLVLLEAHLGVQMEMAAHVAHLVEDRPAGERHGRPVAALHTATRL
jgi:hypothetical protein